MPNAQGPEQEIKSIGTRGGNDMISGAENWDDIEMRMDDKRTQLAEADEKVREVGDGKLDPSDEHALAPICAPHCDPNDDLIKLMASALSVLERIEKYCDDASAQNDNELLGFFKEVQQDERQRLSKARTLFATRFHGHGTEDTHLQ